MGRRKGGNEEGRWVVQGGSRGEREGEGEGERRYVEDESEGAARDRAQGGEEMNKTGKEDEQEG